MNILTVFEFAMSEAQKASVGSMFPAYWVAGDTDVSRRGWTTSEPTCRLLLVDGENIVGNCSIFEATRGLPRGLGIGDLAVSDLLRGQGLGRKLLEAADEFFHSSGAEFAFAASRNVSVRKVLRDIGYRTPPFGTLYFQDGDYWSWNETWLVKGDLHPSSPTQLLSDF